MFNVRLRRAARHDAAQMALWREQPSSLRFQASPRRSIDEIRAMLDEQSAVDLGPTAIGRLYWVIVVDGEPGGYLQLDVSPGFRQQDMATLGYTVAEAMQGRGVATEAVRLATRIAFGAGGLGLERIEAVAAVENTASRRVLEKAGFQFEGVRRGLLRIQGRRVDHACYGLLVTDRNLEEI